MKEMNINHTRNAVQYLIKRTNEKARMKPAPAQIRISCQECSKSLNHSSNGIGSRKPERDSDIKVESGMQVLSISCVEL